jgi:hypothetical protein
VSFGCVVRLDYAPSGERKGALTTLFTFIVIAREPGARRPAIVDTAGALLLLPLLLGNNLLVLRVRRPASTATRFISESDHRVATWPRHGRPKTGARPSNSSELARAR